MTDYSKADDVIFDASKPSGVRWETIKVEDMARLIQLTSEAEEKTIQLKEITTLATYLYESSKNVGNYVKLSREFGFCPALIDNNEEYIPLFHFIEVLDELVDYDKIIEEFPSLTYSHINGAISFLRKVVQFNIKGFNIDEIMDEELATDLEFLSDLRKALADVEVTRVLNFD